MNNPARKQVIYGILILLVIPSILLIVGCASQQKVETSLSTAVPQNLINKVALEDSDEGKRIIIEAEAPLVYTFFRIVPQPLKLVVDIPQTELAPGITATLPVDDEVIKEVTAIQRDEDVEVSIYLNKLVRYEFQKEGDFLYVDMGKQSPLLAQEEELEIVKEMPPSVQEEEIAQPLAPAQNLIDVSVDSSHKDRVILSLKADGTLGDYNTFDLQKPTRLVIDLWKVKRKFRSKTVSVNSPYLERVRLGDHPQKVRVVLDCPMEVLPSHWVDRIGSNLVIMLGKKEAVAQAISEKPKEKEVAEEEVPKVEAEVVPPSLAITGEITGIDFKQLEDKSRIVISTSAKALYEVEKGPEDTVLLEIKGMEVPLKLSRPLDTHEFASPVSMITPLNVAVGDQNNTKVIVKLRKMVAFDVTQENDRIYLDFERPEEFKVEKPKPLEVVTVEKPPVEEEVTPPEVIAPMPAPEAEVSPAPAAPAKEAMEKVYTGKKITLDFKDADIDNILRLFAEVSDLNIITTEDVKGTVTVRLVDVPWDQAFDIILQSKNLGVERIGNVIRIAPLARISEEKKLRASAAKATEELEPLVTELIQVNYSTATELAPKVTGLLSSRGTVTVDERTNTLIVKDIQANIVTAKDLVRILDAQTPQILIQAKVIEANLDFGRELGIQWGGSFFEPGNESSPNISASGDSPAGGNWAVNLPAAVGSGAGGAIEFAIANLTNTRYLQARISALETKGQGKIISSPRVTTLDHTEASIEQGLRIPYLKLTEEGTATTDFIEANLKLLVTPHVTADGHIKMEIAISKDTPDQSIVVQGVPSIDKKEVKTEVLVMDGEVVVIGGIYTYTKSGTVDAVPLFYKIPLLGWLFQKRTKDDTKRELLIFIAPRIVQPRRTATS